MATMSQFINSWDNVVAFRPRMARKPEEILEMELKHAHERLTASTSLRCSFRLTLKGREFLLEENADQRYWASKLKRAIERYVVRPLQKLHATAQIKTGDMLVIDRHPSKKALVFFKDKDEAMRQNLAPLPPEPKEAA